MDKHQSLEINTIYSGPSSWWQHIPVAHFLIEKIRPNVVVELGSHYGVSLFGFCEAIEYFKLDSHVYAIDTWSGDCQAGYYGEDVYELVLNHRNLYHNQKCELLRELFDNAKEYFGEKTIDLLHIDGLHTYDAVKNDYENWLPKVKDGGTILFHDTNVRRDGFGVWKLWEEIKERKEYSFLEIKNGHGLGILTLDIKAPEWHEELRESLGAIKNKGMLLEKVYEREAELDLIKNSNMIKDKHIINLELMLKNKDNETTAIRSELKRLQPELDSVKSELERVKSELEIRKQRESKSWRRKARNVFKLVRDKYRTYIR